MTKLNDGRDFDLDYYNLFLRRYLTVHRFPEAEDDLLIAARSEEAADKYVESRLAGDEVFISNEKAFECLLKGFDISPYEFVSDILTEEFSDKIPLDDRSIEFWTTTILEEIQSEFNGVELSNEFIDKSEGSIFKLTIIGRISDYFDEYGL